MKPNQKMVDRHGVEVALFPIEDMTVTQDVDGAYSHKGKMAIDFGGRGKQIVYAPCDCKVVHKTNVFNAVVFQSLRPVRQPGGVITPIFFALLHDNDISDIEVGQVFKQGEKIYDEGGAGPTGIAGTYASHVHLMVARGTYMSGIPFNSVGGSVTMKFAIDPRKVFFINGTNLLKVGNSPWEFFYDNPVVGDYVYIRPTAVRWATGTLIKPYVKKNGTKPGPYKILADGDNPPKGKRYPKGAWLLGGVVSWIRKVDVE